MHAVSLSASDWEVLRGKPLYSRIAGPFRRATTSLVQTSPVGLRRRSQRDAVPTSDEMFADILTLWAAGW